MSRPRGRGPRLSPAGVSGPLQPDPPHRWLELRHCGKHLARLGSLDDDPTIWIVVTDPHGGDNPNGTAAITVPTGPVEFDRRSWRPLLPPGHTKIKLRCQRCHRLAEDLTERRAIGWFDNMAALGLRHQIVDLDPQ